MKKYISVSLFLFWAIIVAILTAGLVFYNNSSQVNSLTKVTTNKVDPKPTTVKPLPTPSLTTTELTKHNIKDDCWLLINNNIYSVTTYLRMHPGGVRTITPYCGQDATAAFATSAGGHQHSSQANSLLQEYLLGPLK